MIYVMSDIHGVREKFDSVMSKINLRSEDTLYILGDVIDRGKDGIGILLDLMKRENVTMLLGNHELMMYNATRDDPLWYDTKLWYINNGHYTQEAFNDLKEDMRAEIRKFIFQMPVYAEIEVNGNKFILVHGAPPDLQKESSGNDIRKIEIAVWTRLNADDKMPENKTVIFGHTPTNHYQDGTPLKIWHGNDKIGIDCGCGHPHPACRLACLRLDDMAEFYSD